MAAAWGRSGEEWVLRAARRFGLGRNPLRRRVDRIESLIVLCAVLLGLLIVPAAAALGTAVGHASERAAEQRRASLTQVQARTLESTDPVVTEVPGAYSSRVKVGWTDPAGWPHEGSMSMPAGTRAGTPVTIWLDNSGAIAPPPRTASDSNAMGGAIGLSAAMISWLVLAGLTRLAVALLDRRRIRDWEREWAHVAPRWRHPQN